MNINLTRVTMPIEFPRWRDRGTWDEFLGLENGEIPCVAIDLGDGRTVICNDKGNVMADLSNNLFNLLFDEKTEVKKRIKLDDRA